MIDNEFVSTLTDETVEAAEIPETGETNAQGTEEAPVEKEEEVVEAAEVDSVNYAEIAANDLRELKEIFPELSNVTDLTQLQNPLRYAALRDLGLTAEEAYLATSPPKKSYDTRTHLTSTVPAGAFAGVEMSRSEYDMAREIFSGLSDSEIRKLYRKVTK